ncbi:MAG: N-acetylmuramoyl-L-alanine amidase [Hyphomicrobiaceae bacterium]
MHRACLIALAAASLTAWTSTADAVSRGPRRATVDTVIVHTISGPDHTCRKGRVEFSGAPGDAARWKRFFERHPFLSIHYVIDREGRIAASVPELQIANHALDNNDTSVGIELVHQGDGVEPFPKAQIDALIRLVRDIRKRHTIPLENVKGHSDVDTRTFRCGGRIEKRKQDPGANFPWPQVRAALAGRRPVVPVALTDTPVKGRAGAGLGLKRSLSAPLR